jgi:nicotinate phosphoribosyltransferase
METAKNNDSAFFDNDKIITSMLDTDFYKLTMMQAVLHHYPNAKVEWAFKCRNSEDLVPYIDEIQRQINMLNEISLSEKEESFLQSISYFKPDFIRFMKLFRFDPSYVSVEEDNGQLSIRLKGPWLHVILYEIVLLAIVSEVRNRILYPHITMDQALGKLYSKFGDLEKESKEVIEKFTLADFGTRRRFSSKVQSGIIDAMIKDFPGKFVGTSNVLFAMEKGIKPIGTMAHEWIMAHQQLGARLIDSQKQSLETWVQEYRGELGIALTDCVTTDAFLKDFDLYFAKLFDGLRHDSGDPIVFANKCIARYNELGIDPKTKTLVFSDGLSFDKCISIIKNIDGKINNSYGMGTNLTCDIDGVEPLNIVIKMISCNGQPVAKISDSPGKGMCEDPEFVTYIKHVFKVEH